MHPISSNEDAMTRDIRNLNLVGVTPQQAWCERREGPPTSCQNVELNVRSGPLSRLARTQVRVLALRPADPGTEGQTLGGSGHRQTCRQGLYLADSGLPASAMSIDGKSAESFLQRCTSACCEGAVFRSLHDLKVALLLRRLPLVCHWYRAMSS